MPTILITGANRGLGLEFVRQYAADGARVIACCRAPAAAEALNKLAADHSQVTVEELDVIRPASIAALAGRLQGGALDVFINNAGVLTGSTTGASVAGDPSQTFGTLDSDAWDYVLRINTIAPIMLAEAFSPHVAASGQGKIINISSSMGSLARGQSGFTAYRSSKAALNSAMLSIAVPLAKLGITIANLHPGWVQTDMGGQGADITPEESISGMRKVIAALTLKDTGRFLDYTGAIVPW